MTTYKISNATITLQDLGENAGKITIASPNFNSSYYWGAMAGTLHDFLLHINKDYFIRKLGHSQTGQSFDGRKTARTIRKTIKEFLPWYKHTEFQKTMRPFIKEVENITFQHDFSYWVGRFNDLLDYHLILDDYDKKEIESEIVSMMGEWWHLIETSDSNETKWLGNLFTKLQARLKKELLVVHDNIVQAV